MFVDVILHFNSKATEFSKSVCVCVCSFVCFLPNSSKTTIPFLGIISLCIQVVLGQKTSGFAQLLAAEPKKYNITINACCMYTEYNTKIIILWNNQNFEGTHDTFTINGKRT